MLSVHERQAEVLKAMAHPVRLRLLEALTQGECCVCHLTALLGQRQPYISQQLMKLREAGLVADRREGTMVYYRLAGDWVAQALVAARLFLAEEEAATALLDSQEPLSNCSCPRCATARVG